MWAEPTRQALIGFEDADGEAEVFNSLVAFAIAIGADLVSYHHLEPSTSKTEQVGTSGFSLFSYGFPEDWVNTYRSTNYHQIDPITAYAMYQTRPVLWSDVPNRVTLTEQQQAYMADLYRWLSPGDGFAIPLFGPSSRHGYGSIGWRNPIPPWDRVTRRIVQSVFESFHLRICELRLTNLKQDFELSEKQVQILRAIASGHTDAMICETFNLRSEELKILVARLVIKMQVTDRPSAILRARALGIVER